MCLLTVVIMCIVIYKVSFIKGAAKTGRGGRVVRAVAKKGAAPFPQYKNL